MNGGVDFGRLKRGDRLHLQDGSSVRFLNLVSSSVALVLDGSGRENAVSEGEVAAVSTAPPGPEWGARVTIVLHQVPESEETEGGFEAVTMGGVPFGVSVTASGTDSAGTALDHILGALKAFGYSGIVTVEDATYIGGVQRYEVQVP